MGEAELAFAVQHASRHDADTPVNPSEGAWSPDDLVRHAGWIRRLAHQLVRDPADAEDLVQQAWLAAAQAPPAADRPLRPWLSRVVRNLAAQRLRRGAARRAREEEVARAEGVPDAATLIERAETARRLVEMVLELPDPYRSTLLLRFYEDLSPTEIARRYGLHAGTVRTRSRRALEMLRAKMQTDEQRSNWALLAPLAPLPRGAERWEAEVWDTEVREAEVREAACQEATRRADGIRDATSWRPESWNSPLAWNPTLVWKASLVIAASVLVVATWVATRRSDRVEGFGARAERVSGANSGRVVLASESGGAQPERSEGTRLPLAAEPASSRRWRVVSAHDGSPLPGYRLAVGDRRLRSGVDGFVDAFPGAVRALPGAGSFVDELVSHGRRRSRSSEPVDLEAPDPPEVDLRVPAGPCFEFTWLGFPGELGELEARLEPESSDGRTIEGFMIQVAAPEPAVPGFAHPWVRFAGEPEGARDPSLRWSLVLRDRAGFWRGVAPLDDVLTTRTRSVRIDVQPTAVLELTFAHPPSERGSIGLSHEGGVDRRFLIPVGNRAVARWMRPGRWTVSHRGPGQSSPVLTCELEAGQREVRTIANRGAAASGRIAGEVRTQTGREAGQLLVFLLDSNGEVHDVCPPTWSGEVDDRRAPFVFDDLPIGEYSVDVVSLASAVSLVGQPPRVYVPTEDLVIELRDAGPRTDWAVEVVDERTDATIDAFEFEVRIDGGFPRTFRHSADHESPWLTIAGSLAWNRFEGEAPLRALASTASFEWRVRAAGYETARGDQSAFAIEAPDLRRLRVLLVPE